MTLEVSCMSFVKKERNGERERERERERIWIKNKIIRSL